MKVKKPLLYTLAGIVALALLAFLTILTIDMVLVGKLWLMKRAILSSGGSLEPNLSDSYELPAGSIEAEIVAACKKIAGRQVHVPGPISLVQDSTWAEKRELVSDWVSLNAEAIERIEKLIERACEGPSPIVELDLGSQWYDTRDAVKLLLCSALLLSESGEHEAAIARMTHAAQFVNILPKMSAMITQSKAGYYRDIISTCQRIITRLDTRHLELANSLMPACNFMIQESFAELFEEERARDWTDYDKEVQRTRFFSLYKNGIAELFGVEHKPLGYSWSLPGFAQRAMMRRDLLEVVRLQSRMIDLAKGHPASWKEWEPLLETAKDRIPQDAVMAQVTMSNHVNFIRNVIMAKASGNVAVAALVFTQNPAILQGDAFRDPNGVELPAELLGSWAHAATDPFTGEPLLVAIDPDGTLRVWSRGVDCTNDGGKGEIQDGRDKGTDLVFRIPVIAVK